SSVAGQILHKRCLLSRAVAELNDAQSGNAARPWLSCYHAECHKIGFSEKSQIFSWWARCHRSWEQATTIDAPDVVSVYFGYTSITNRHRVAAKRRRSLSFFAAF